MLISSPVIAAGSGSIAGLTASHNRGGLYLRARAVPTNPNSSRQQAVRGYLSTLVNRWTSTLTAAKRDAWTAYAANTPVFNALGAQIYLTGQQMYLRGNVPRLQGSLPVVDDAPTVNNTGEVGAVAAASFTASSQTLSLSIDNTVEWATTDDAALQVFWSDGQNPSVNYFKGPYRNQGQILGDGTTPPTSPASIVGSGSIAAGQRVFCKVNATQADGRYSAPVRFQVAAS